MVETLGGTRPADQDSHAAEEQPHPPAQPHEGAASSELPDLGSLPDLVLYSHSTIFYWWPAWLGGYALALVTWLGGSKARLSNGSEILIHPSAWVGLTFLVILTLVMIFTNVKLRGLYSVMFLLAIGFFVVLFGWLGWLDAILAWIPYLSVYMDLGFYLTFSTLLLAIWLLRFFVFDRLTYWRVRPGQLTMERVIGGGAQSYDTRGMLFEQRGDDLFRHIILGLGSGDLLLITTGAKKGEIEIPNVLFARRKVATIERLIAIKPDEAMSRASVAR
jgi:hypothetical protein